MANPNMITLCVATALTPVAVGAHLWAVVQPQPEALLAANLLDTVALIAWVAYISSWYTARLVRRVDELERAHAARLYADAVTAPAPLNGSGRFRRLT